RSSWPPPSAICMASWRSLQARAARRPGGPMPTAPRPSRFRLPADVRPTGYDLLLEPDLEGGRFRGEVRIALRLARPRAEIVLHATEITIERAAAHGGGREIPARVRLSRADETAALRFARPRSEERRVGKESRARGGGGHGRKEQ